MLGEDFAIAGGVKLKNRNKINKQIFFKVNAPGSNNFFTNNSIYLSNHHLNYL